MTLKFEDAPFLKTEHIADVAEGAILWVRYLIEKEERGPHYVAWNVWHAWRLKTFADDYGYNFRLTMLAGELGARIFHALKD